VGCFTQMLGNGKCDSACNTPECMYDKDDCPCNPGCSYLDFPSCKADCLVPSCHYGNHGQTGGCQDQFLLELTWAAQSLAKDHTAQFDMAACQHSSALCTPAILEASWNSQTCVKDQQAHCSTTQCVYGLGFCVASLTDSCARGYGKTISSCFKCKPGYAKLYSLCLEYCPRKYQLSKDDFCVVRKDTSSLETPGDLYVSDSKQEGDGSLSWPFGNLGLAFVAMWQQYTTIHLQGNSVLLDLDFISTHPELLTYRLLGANRLSLIRVSSLTCDMMWTEHCSPQYTEINIIKPWTIYANYTLILERVFITSKRLFAGLSMQFCPELISVGGKWLLDDGQPASEDAIIAAGLCAPFSDYSVVVAMYGGSVTFRDVEVTSFALKALALIEIQGGNVVLERVNFRDIQTRRGKYSGGVIVQKESCSDPVCGSFTYTNGTVRNLNNGLRYLEGLLLTPFLHGVALRDIAFANVTFEHNLVVDAFSSTEKASPTALIYLNTFYNLTIGNCTFRANFVTGGLIAVDSMVILPKLSDAQHVAYMYSYTHITLSNLLFDSNLGESSLISILFQRDVLNVNMSALVFRNNAVEGYGLVSIQSTRTAKSALAYGETKTVLSATTNELENLWIAPRHVSVIDVNITKTMSAASLIIVENCANVNLTSVNIVENGDMDEDVFNRTFQIYLSSPEIIATDPPLFPFPSTCAHFLYFEGNIRISLQRISLSANLCTFGIWGAYLISNLDSVSVLDITARDNTGVSFAGSMLAVSENTVVQMQKVTAVNNTNWDGGVLSFGVNSQVTLQEALFQDNIGANGAAVSCGNVRKFTASRLVFRNNTSMGKNGGGLYFLAGNNGVVSYSLTDCQFDSNSANKGGGYSSGGF